MKIDNTLFNQLRHHRFEMPANVLSDIENRLDKASYDALLYTKDGHLVAVKKPLPGEASRDFNTFLIFPMNASDDLKGNWFDDYPEFFTVTFDNNAKNLLTQKLQLLKDESITSAILDYPGAGFNHVHFDFEEDGDFQSPDIGSGAVRLNQSAFTFRIEYECTYNLHGNELIVSNFINDVINLDQGDILGPLMIPRIIAWGTESDYQLALDNLDLEEAVFELVTPAMTALAARIVRTGELDAVSRHMLQQDAVKHFLRVLIDRVDSVNRADISAELKNMALQNEIDQNKHAPSRKRTL